MNNFLPDATDLTPRIGDNVCVSYKFWTNKGKQKTKYRNGTVLAVVPFDCKYAKGYNIKVRTFLPFSFFGLFDYWHQIDDRNAKVAFNGYPAWADKCPKSAH